ncbi:MAG: hypothetical protein IKB34_05865 [Clostridia bacterium]|nr:hypothetical protein [Clostridia bacterium]
MNSIPRHLTALILFFAWIFAAFFSVIPISSCSPHPDARELFFFRSSDLTATVTVKCNGIESQAVYRRENGRETLSLTAPEELKDLVFTTENGAVTLSLDGLSVVAPQPLTVLPSICTKIFSPSPENVTAAEPVYNGTNGTLTKVTVGGIALTLDENGIPVLAEGAVDGIPFSAEIRDFAVITAENADNGE